MNTKEKSGSTPGLDFEKYPDKLIPTVVQENQTGRILMVGFADQAAVDKTLESGLATFWSRSQKKAWTKGLTSGDTLKVSEIRTDCDNDTLIYLVDMEGKGACHIDGWVTCFRRRVSSTGQIEEVEDIPTWSRFDSEEQAIIEARSEADPKQSFTAKMAQSSLEKIAGKIAEETAEVLKAVQMGERRERIISELADCDYVSRILLAKINQMIEEPISIIDIEEAVIARRK